MTFDPTKNCIPFGLLNPEEQEALREWPHGWEIYNVYGEWGNCKEPSWYAGCVYRGKPAPKIVREWFNVYPEYTSNGHQSREVADSWVAGGRIAVYRIERHDDGSNPQLIPEPLGQTLRPSLRQTRYH